MKKLDLLIIDDEPRILEELSEYIANMGYAVYRAVRPSEAFAILGKDKIDIALVDIKLPEYDGIELIKRMKLQYPDVEVIVMSGHGDMDNVIEAFRLGAFDYLRKPFSTMELQMAISRTKKYLMAQHNSQRLADICTALNQELAGDGNIVGKTPVMEKVRENIRTAAANAKAPVLIQGESGTGKELAARNIHAMGSRATGRFIAVNCAAVPREMFEAEFFGHEKGAFTDAKSSRAGLFRSATGGTLFLDEIGELPLDLQTKLLRAIEEGEIRAVGSDTDSKTDVRIICATNQDLAAMVRDGNFRSDLYYRIAVIEIKLPPLREHPEDIPLLVDLFINKSGMSYSQKQYYLSKDSIRKLLRYSFPGNVRELRNIVERALISGKNPVEIDLPGENKPGYQLAECDKPDEPLLELETIEKTAIQKAIEKSGGVMSKASELLGITRQSLDRRIKKYNL